MKSDSFATQVSEQLSEQDILNSARLLLENNREQLQLSRQDFTSLIGFDHCRQMRSDGSTRRFWRLGCTRSSYCIIVAPAKKSPEELAESEAAWKIGTHLFNKGVSVPQLFGWDGATGVLLFEDLGDQRLHDAVLADSHFSKMPSQQVREYYQAAVKQLAEMQCRGAEGFDRSWCWAGEQYDFQLMTEMESGYFLRAFWQGLLGRKLAGTEKEAVETELHDIARRAGEAPANYFLHRDFQSRNIMLKESNVRFIDFQGGRLGPLAYDLASLLIDPYCKLPSHLQEELIETYLLAVEKYLAIDWDEFRKQFVLLAFQRNMQIVGAFSYLYKIREKPFFKDYIKPSLDLLNKRLEDPLLKEYMAVRTIVKKGVQEL